MILVTPDTMGMVIRLEGGDRGAPRAHVRSLLEDYFRWMMLHVMDSVHHSGLAIPLVAAESLLELLVAPRYPGQGVVIQGGGALHAAWP